MKFRLVALISGLLAGVFSVGSTLGQEASQASSPTSEAREKMDLATLEKEFQEAMNGVVMKGRWCLVKDGVMGEDRADQYTIQGVQKGEGDQWTISARIEYGKTDVVVPVPVKVIWAGDTAVITVDNFWVPGGGTYGARVLVKNGQYAGNWWGKGYGGLMYGLIQKSKGEDKKP